MKKDEKFTRARFEVALDYIRSAYLRAYQGLELRTYDINRLHRALQDLYLLYGELYLSEQIEKLKRELNIQQEKED